MSLKRYPIKKNADGSSYLHIWRTGQSYYRQKSHLFLSEWTNLQFSVLPHPNRGEIIYHDIRTSIPFADNSFDVVYALHILEHLTLHQGKDFVREVLRVLKPGGILRISTPDQEDIVRAYLKKFKEGLEDESPDNLMRYRWAQLEFADQMVRDNSGGLMAEAVASGDFDDAYAKERYGDVWDEFFPENSHHHKQVAGQTQPKEIKEKKAKKSLMQIPGLIYRLLEFHVYKIFRRIKQKLLRGDPRKIVETNKWVYDQLSLKLFFEKNGFKDYSVKTYKTSDIKGWQRYNFDCSEFGDHPIEPSLYAEARKPNM